MPLSVPLLISALLAAPSLVRAAAASTSVVNLLLPDFDSQSILASVISVESTATEYFLACPTGEDASDCGLGPGIRAKEGPSTLELHMTYEPTLYDDVSCVLDGKDATCTLEEHSGSISSRSVNVVSDYSTLALPVTITAGLDLLSGSSTAAGGGGTTTTPTASPAHSTALTGSVTPAPTASGSGSGTGAGAAATSSKSKDAAPRTTGMATLAGLAAAAAVVGGGALLW